MPITPDIAAAETAIVEMTNAFRAEHKLAPVRQNPKLAAAAQAYARKLTGYAALSHTADGTTPSDRVSKAGYSFCQVGENLASVYDSRGFTGAEYAKRSVEGWENSPGHRKNMLLPFATETGVAIARTSSDEPKYIAVQLFGRPASAKYSFKVANAAAGPVTYSIDGKPNTVVPRETITHTLCLPANVDFALGGAQPAARYEARNGQVYTLRSSSAGITVDVGGAKRSETRN